MKPVIKIGVLSHQGSIFELIDWLKRTSQKDKYRNYIIDIYPILNVKDLESADAIAVPGGESGTFNQTISRKNMELALCEHVRMNKPYLGMCAGTILYSSILKKIHPESKFKLIRNGFGRQYSSFYQNVEIKLNRSVRMEKYLFIRAPKIISLNDDEVFAKVGKDIQGIISRKNNILVSFHPELSKYTTVAEYFINMAIQKHIE